MAPPQVDLAKKQPEKQPLEDVQNWAQKVGDLKLPVLPPITTVPVESKKKARCKRRFKPLVVGFIVGFIFAAIIAGIAVAAHRGRRHHHKDEWDCDVEKHHHRREHHHGHHSGEDSGEDDDAKEHMMADGSKLYIARNGTQHFFEMYAILDFEAHMAGFKDADRQRCFVDKLPEDEEEGREKWRRCKHDRRRPGDRPVRVVNPAMDQDVLRYVAGEDISKLCQGLTTHWVVPVPADQLVSITDEIIYL